MTALPIEGTAPKKRLPVLDGIRGICAIGVVFTHVAFATFVRAPNVGPKSHSIWSILAAGQLSIGPFFIMSGLLLYRPFVRRTFLGTPNPKLGVFFLRRAARILPAFWLVVAFDLLLLNYTAIHSVWDVLRPFTLMHIYSFHFYAGMDVLWTVPTEVQFYLVLPLLAMVTHLIGKRIEDPLRKAQAMIAPLLLLIVVEIGWTAWVHEHYKLWPSQYFYPFSVAGLFAIGMILSILSVLGQVAPDRKPSILRLAATHPNWFWIAAAGVYALNCAQPFGVPGTASWQTTPAALVRDACLLAFSALIMVPLIEPGSSSKFMNVLLTNPAIRYSGRISYGIYLWHFTIMYMRYGSGSVFGKIIPVQLELGKYGFWEIVIPTMAGAILAASLSFFILERPLIKLTERLVKTPPPTPAGGVPTSPTVANPATP